MSVVERQAEALLQMWNWTACDTGGTIQKSLGFPNENELALFVERTTDKINIEQ